MKRVISRKEAISYICQNKKGTIKDLTKNIGAKNVKALELTGFIQRGQEKLSKDDSWAITSVARNVIHESNKSQTFMDKIHDFINYSLMRNTTKPKLA